MADFRKPIFFPDATRAVVRTLDTKDIEETMTPGVLVNTLHVKDLLGTNFSDVKTFMNWKGLTISDSGGFQIMSLAKKLGKAGAVTDEGVSFDFSGKTTLLTPEDSIRFQLQLGTDLMVVLDDFTAPGASYEEAKITVERTIAWAKRCKDIFEEETKDKDKKPLLIGVVQGGDYLDLRSQCAQELASIGFDGFGYGGWPVKSDGTFDFEVAKVIADSAPEGYLLYGLGIGKPEDIVGCVKLGYTIFDCVLPSRDARHGRLYVYDAPTIDEIDLTKPFYHYYTPAKTIHLTDRSPISTACDCRLCTTTSRAYLAHLWKIKDPVAMRLSTIHNLRFYSLLMEKLNKDS